VRPSSDAGTLGDAGAEVVTGDLRDARSLEAACHGVDAVVTTATASRRPDAPIEDVDGDGNLRLIDAARRAGVRHFVFTSTPLASGDSPVPLFRAKAAAEAALLQASDMTWTVLHANAFMDVWFAMLIEMPLAAGTPVTLVGESRRRHSFVAEDDVASVAAAAVDSDAARNAIIPVGGPDAVTLREVVAAYESALGRPIPVRSVAPGEPLPGLPPLVSQLASALESFDSPMPMEETARTFRVTLTDVRAFARARIAASAR
jgi:NADH dehydrogenase